MNWLGRGSIFWKYVAVLASAIGVSLLVDRAVELWFTYQDHRSALIRVQSQQAVAAADKITQFVREIEGQLAWMTHLSWAATTIEQRQIDGWRLLRQVPAITSLTMLDGEGRERLRVSRQAMDRIGSNIDHSGEAPFKIASNEKVYRGPVYFERESEPFMLLAMAGARREAGVVIAAVNLKHIWDVVNQIQVGTHGKAYVVDANGRLIAHPDLSLVLRNTDFSEHSQFRAARARGSGLPQESVESAFDESGQRVLSAQAMAAPLKWLVFVDVPEHEANAPLYAAITRSVIIVIGGLALALLAALFLARRMITPIQTLSTGASRIGSGALDHRIAIDTGDELETLGSRFNEMAAHLQDSYATLESKVEARTRELEAANLSKSRFLAAASHDLRQPLHALNLLVGQLRTETDPRERQALAARIERALSNMNELFDGLLDISKLDAGVVAPQLTEFPIQRLLEHVDATFSATAAGKGLSLRIAPSTAWVRSDPALLERIVFNLVANAVRYTRVGGIVVGVRRRGANVSIEVIDTGIGVPAERQERIFSEFYQIAPPGSARGDGLGLGLAIVERLCTLLGHHVALQSEVGVGSRFSVTLPRVATQPIAAPVANPVPLVDPLHGKRVVVIDNDALVLESTAGILRSWGCEVVVAASAGEALDRDTVARPDLLIADFHLAHGEQGVDAIAGIRARFAHNIPAFLVSGDITGEPRRAAETAGLHLLDKPLSPLKLRAMAMRMLSDASTEDPASSNRISLP